MAKFIALSIIVTITLYFGYAFIHANRKSFERDQEFEKMQKLITNKETELLEINAKLNLLKKVKRHLQNILLVFTFMRHLSKADV